MNDGYGIMRIEKRHRKDVKGIQRENNRETKNLPASDIDWDKSTENVYIQKSEDWIKTINDICNQYGVKPRKDSVVMLDGFYGLSPESAARLQRDCQGSERDYIREYFDDCIEYHKSHYGEVISAVIHYDETTPHLHITSVPVYTDPEGKGHLSAKEMLGHRKDYRERQDDFYEQISQKYGLMRGTKTLDNEEKRKHLSTLEYKQEQAEKGIEIAEEQAELILGDSEANADNMLFYAEKEADEVIENAENKADEIIREAEQQAKSLKANYQEKLERLENNPEIAVQLLTNQKIHNLEKENERLKAENKGLRAFKDKAVNFVKQVLDKVKMSEKLKDMFRDAFEIKQPERQQEYDELEL